MMTLDPTSSVLLRILLLTACHRPLSSTLFHSNIPATSRCCPTEHGTLALVSLDLRRIAHAHKTRESSKSSSMLLDALER